MKNLITIECPTEILLGLHLDVDEFAEQIKKDIAFRLYGEGKISSGMGAKWLNIPRIHFLLRAMEKGVMLLENNEDDFLRETSLL
ncbi:MAG: UPF0175 family protein [Leptospiraceae bacterium]|nr:UPF0175 family protein [Leptospiraceae bacterium]